MRRFAVLGHPINHSFSPVMHMASFRSIGFDGEYTRLDVPPEMLGDALRALSAEGFSGVNLTIPHKQLALPMMDALTPEAQRLGAVNTVRFEEGGKLSGHNTDGPGFLAAAKATLGLDPAGRRVAVVGCGGAGRAVAITLAHAGAQVGLIDIDRDRAEALADEIRASGRDAAVIGRERIREADLIAQCSPSGLAIFPEPAVRAEEMRPGQALYDIVIPPGDPVTPTMKEARTLGIPCANGVRMLVEQGALSFTYWTGLEADRAAMLRAVEEGLARHE
ncbi:MAG TPA: shikimate dehydrogenase [Candidatus Spyradenecus faecavium]|uniref:Shikimate dehydrogenase (NADP(+)) n=1 Tax=Candidatus Spyradenecus faecavium TaxID=2840947 RepID=A0A9D1NPG8_9BACT|nr:shikimate dehydrogenase [Candidatus Spyradenecus faecavium]